VLKKEITYEDYDGVKVTDTFWFQLNVPEITELGFANGGMQAEFKKIVETENSAALVTLFRKFLVRSVGKRSEDGKKFIKNAEITSDFMDTNAYSAFFQEMMENNGLATEFFAAVVPTNLSEKMTELMKDDEVIETMEEHIHTKEELLAMTSDQFDMVAGTDFRSMTPVQQLVAFQRKSAA
jgi:hypothetical protein